MNGYNPTNYLKLLASSFAIFAIFAFQYKYMYKDFRERVWDVVRSVPPGRVVTYGQVATLLGAPRAARAVGTVLKNTPPGADVPCQRVVNRWGRLAPTYGSGGTEQHKAELEAEGVEVRSDYTVDLEVYRWWPNG